METTTIIIAICAFVVSVISTCLATWTAFVQGRHMQLSVQPIASIPVADFVHRIGVYIQNKGLGPMRIVALRVLNDKGMAKDDIVSHMPKLNPEILWSNFYVSVDGATLEPGKRFDLLLLEGDPKNPAYKDSHTTRHTDRVPRAVRLIKKV